MGENADGWTMWTKTTEEVTEGTGRKAEQLDNRSASYRDAGDIETGDG